MSRLVVCLCVKIGKGKEDCGGGRDDLLKTFWFVFMFMIWASRMKEINCSAC